MYDFGHIARVAKRVSEKMQRKNEGFMKSARIEKKNAYQFDISRFFFGIQRKA